MDAIHLLDDSHSAGRISESKRIPLANVFLAGRDPHDLDGIAAHVGGASHAFGAIGQEANIAR